MKEILPLLSYCSVCSLVHKFPLSSPLGRNKLLKLSLPAACRTRAAAAAVEWPLVSDTNELTFTWLRVAIQA